MKTVAIFDLDHTITAVDTYPRFLLRLLAVRPFRWWRVSMFLLDVIPYRLGYRDNHWLKERAFIAVAAGAPIEHLRGPCRQFAEALVGHHVRAGALEAIERHRAAGDRLVLATASFDLYVEPLARALGFDAVACTIAEADDRGRLTGRIAGRNCYGEQKVSRVAATIDEREAWNVVVYTDHASDLQLLEWADVAHPVCASPDLRRIAAQRGWASLEW